MTIVQFFQKYDGRFVDYDHVWGFQCVDLMRQFVKELYGVNPYAAIPQTGAAKNIFNNFIENRYFKKIYNSPTNMPQKGDLVFWRFYPFVTGWAGHVAICSEASLMTMITFDQNYPTGQPCKYVRHSYKGCLGWLKKK